VAAATVVDHITPHKLKEALLSGDAAAISKAQKLFWSRNWQGLCKQHHDSTKQRMEKRGSIIGCDESGIPSTRRRTGSNDNVSHVFRSQKGRGRVKVQPPTENDRRSCFCA
jgi:hypothetical protein